MQKQILNQVCRLVGHVEDIEYVCMNKECKQKRIGCIKCKNDIHNHESQSQYLSFGSFRDYIQKIIEIQLQQYKQNQEYLRMLRQIDTPDQIVNECIEFIAYTQEKLLWNFQIAEKRFQKYLYYIDNNVLNQMVELEYDNIQDDCILIQEFLSQIKSSGLKIKAKENMQIPNQQFILENQEEIKSIKKEVQSRYFHLNVSPDGVYLACEDGNFLKIFIIKSHRLIVKKNRPNSDHVSRFGFSQDSRFYFYSNKEFIHFQRLPSKKRIFSFRISFQLYFVSFPFLFQAIAVGLGDFFTIINIQNRKNMRFFIDEKYDSIEELDYDNLNNVVVFLTLKQRIIFFKQNTYSLIFKKQLVYDFDIKGDVKFLDQDNYIIIGGGETHLLCMVNYQKRQFYCLKSFSSGKIQYLLKIIGFRYSIYKIESELYVLDENLNIYQIIKTPYYYQKQHYQIKIFTQNKIKFIKYICT